MSLRSLVSLQYLQGSPEAGKHAAASLELAGVMSETAGAAGSVGALGWQAGQVQGLQRTLVCMLDVGRGVRHLKQGG